MRIAPLCFALAASLSIGAPLPAAFAQQSGTGMKKEAMTMPEPAPQMAPIFKMFGHGATWTGEVPAGALGPHSPATTSHGMAGCRTTAGGFWVTCELEDTMGSGKAAKTWRGHMIVGYDLGSKSYRAVVVDNTGGMFVYNGTMEGDTLTLETPDAAPILGTMMKDRLTFVAGPDGRMKSFTDEHQVAEGGWTPFETVDHVKLVGTPGKAK
jgi:hypothetical protein